MPQKKKTRPKIAGEPPDYQIRWKNFRGFRDTGWVTLRPLTVLIGPNNSGKTSVLAPLLLLNQTLLSDDVSTPLVTKGPLIDAGAFQNIARNHDVTKDVFFGIRFHTHEEHPKPFRRVGTYAPGALELTFKAAENPYSCELKKYEVYDIFLRSYLSRMLQRSGQFSISGIPIGSVTESEKRAITQAQPVNFLFSATHGLYTVQDQDKKDDRSFKTAFTPQFNHYLAIVGFVFNEIRTLLRELSYIGPLREPPRHLYEISAERPRTVGPSGKRAPNLLRARFTELKRKLNFWVRAFEMGDSLRLRTESEASFEIDFLSNKPRREINIADAGFGTSQVLPLIIQALASQEGSLTIAEQPEIHLNPRLQGVLADLFVEMATTGRRVVIETHSEHLILRLRTLLASGKISQDQVALYYVEKDLGASHIREVQVQDNGHILSENWPTGFFGDTLLESLALADAQAKRARKQ